MKKNPIVSLNRLLLSLSPIELSLLAYLLGLISSNELSGEELEALGNFYELLGQTLLTIGAQVENDNTKTNINIDELYNNLKTKINSIESIIGDL